MSRVWTVPIRATGLPPCSGQAVGGRCTRNVAAISDYTVPLHPGASAIAAAVDPAMADSVIGVLKGRLMAIDLVREGRLSGEDYYAARRHLVAYTEYAARQQYFAMSAPADNPACTSR